MHPDAYAYVEKMVAEHPLKGRVVEFGSYDVNGGVRNFFPDSEFFGIDIRPGKGVDLVSPAEDWDGNGEWDVVVSTETFEHTPNGKEIVASARRALKSGGYFLATMASPERPPHNVDGLHDPAAIEQEHYAGISEEQLRNWLVNWRVLNLEHHPGPGDLYLLAQKP